MKLLAYCIKTVSRLPLLLPFCATTAAAWSACLAHALGCLLHSQSYKHGSHALHLVSKHAWMYHAASQFANNMPCKARKQLPSNTHRFGHGGPHDAEQPEGRW